MTGSEFHFLRPEWLLALFPAVVLIALALRQAGKGAGSEWSGLVDAHLLRHLAVRGEAAGRSRWLGAAFGAGLLAAVLAMAGPTWQKLPTPAYHGGEPSVIVLSLAQSMNATDLVPSRLARAGHKLRDMLDRAKGEDTGFIIYADRPFVAAPLTDDGAVIRQMLPELSTNLMPVLGNRLDLAIAEAQGLLDRAGANAGRIVVLADGPGLDSKASLAAATAAHRAGYSVNVLGVGTEDGARLQTAAGQAIQTQEGQDVTVRLDVEALRELAVAGGGSFSLVTADDTDLQTVFPDRAGDVMAAGTPSDQLSDTWLDMGFYLLFLPVLLAPLAFRRGFLLVLAAGVFLTGVAPSGAQAAGWEDLWLTPDQQAQQAMEAGDYAAAAAGFTDAGRRGAALYRGGDYSAAAGQLSADAYNRGNALAKTGAFEEALAAYDARLAAVPKDADAQFNRDVVAQLLEQQKQGEQDQQQQQDQNGSDQQQSGQDQQQDQDQSGQQQQQARDQASPSEQGSQDQAAQSEQSGQNPSQAEAQTGEPQGAQPEPSQENTAQNEAGKEPGAAEQKPEVQQAGQTPGTEPGEPRQSAQAGEEGQSAGEAAQKEDSAFSQMMDKVLGAETPAAEPSQTSEAMAGNAPVLDQAAEQQLRRVPDDPSGLLRARIRQHYARLRAGGN